MSEIMWHHYEMGNEKQAKELENRWLGVTRNEYIEKKFCEMAVKKHDIPETDDYKEAYEAVRAVFTYHYMKEKYPNNPSLWDEWEENGWHEANNIYDIVSYDTCYMTFADDSDAKNMPWYVKILRHSQVYCGPEEGGTWGVDYEFVKWASFATKEEARAFWEDYNKQASEKESTYQPNYEALGGDDSVSSNYPEGYIPRGWAATKGTCAVMCILPYTVPSQPYYYE